MGRLAYPPALIVAHQSEKVIEPCSDGMNNQIKRMFGTNALEPGRSARLSSSWRRRGRAVSSNEVGRSEDLHLTVEIFAATITLSTLVRQSQSERVRKCAKDDVCPSLSGIG
jgi:hypothetical protein